MKLDYAMVGLCAAIVLMLVLTGCTKEPPLFVTTALPAIPAECKGPWPGEPKLPDRDVKRSEAAKDRVALKGAFRTERHYRRVCLERLETVLPEDAP